VREVFARNRASKKPWVKAEPCSHLWAARLPADLEQAAVEQVAWWFQTRDSLGLKTTWPRDGAYRQFAQLPLVLPVQAVLSHYKRWSL